MAAVACRDSRVKAAAMLDSWMWPVPDADRKSGSQVRWLLLCSLFFVCLFCFVLLFFLIIYLSL